MATGVDNTELTDAFEEFYRDYYRNEIGELAQKYPNDQKSLWVDWDDLYRFDPDLADDVRNRPEQMQDYAEEALRLYDLPVDVKLGQAHVRFHNLPEAEDIREIRHEHHGMLIAVQGIVRKATDVRPKVTNAAFECQRCGTLTRIPQVAGDFQEPHECQGCERQGPFRLNMDQSEFVDAQKIRVQESPEGLRGGETPQAIDVNIEDDITGEVTAGDHVRVTGVLKLDQQGDDRNQSPMFDLYMDGIDVSIEDEQFEDMNITEEDKKEIIELSNEDDLYDKMVGAIAPSIYGYEREKLAMMLQLFSGVTKHLPDGSRIRGDLHMLLIGDPGTGKSQMLSYIQNIAPRSVYTSGKGSSSAGLCVTGDTMIHTDEGFRPIRDLVSSELPEPVSEETSVRKQIDLQTFDRDAGEMQDGTASRAWRMPEKTCRRIETSHGKELEASVNTPVLTCGTDGIEWTEISEVEQGDHVAVPRYDAIDRSEVPVREFLELTTKKVLLTDDSIEFLRESLQAEFGTLRDAAAALDLSEDFIYLHLKNRHVPLEKLDRMLDAIGATREDVDFDRLMIRHGDSITLPEAFDEDLMYLLGLVFGDGDISLDRRGGNRGMVRISNSDEALLERAIEIFDAKFDKRPEIEYQDERVPCIRVNSATIARIFANAGMETPKQDLALADSLTVSEHADAFIRGLMDADGSVSNRDDGGSSVLLSTISDELARQLQLMLETYGVRARTRERDRRGSYERGDGYVIESKHVQQFVEIYGADIDRYAEAIGFDSVEKQRSLAEITAVERRQRETLPIGSTLATVEGAAGQYYQNINRSEDPGRSRARSMLEDVDLGPTEPLVKEAVDADLRWDEVVAAVDTGEKEVFDLTVPETHNFVGNGIVTHNTAAAVRDDFGDGQQWTLEAGALVLADLGIAAVDELDKMNPDDRSAMHQALEQQEISINKAGINATLKSRCSLLGAANPKYGRFDQFEPIGEQIDLEPALISRFDLIFTVTDEPDEEEDRNLASHIIQTNYAGELHTHRVENPTSDYSQEQVDAVTEEVAPTIEPDLLRKYIAHAKTSCFPTMTEEAKTEIEDFYVDLRVQGTDEDAAVPVTARKLEALVRLSEASARIRLSDTVEKEDAERATTIARYCMEQIGVDPETGEFDADVVETGTSKSQRDRIQNLKGIISDIEEEYDEGAPVDVVVERAEEVGIDESKAEHEIEKLKQKGEVYEPRTDHLRTT
ncbi:LAGLIDADG family homing endonuclease [Halomicrobium sp. LC1Hm]|uniref:LAGLIDADG family homing endonuclease n=1 Tax=Halomicrobium sp. LC1Hm TaxID=2610902 RepID=UPI001298535B|nr:LAGLIDADG family homing endonuclease [Halomicrobium sp. LC1Hm]QGA81264.1 DNA endonuclease related to intein-encoded endonuclease [Halomicrobium sp. LC1Hm]